MKTAAALATRELVKAAHDSACRVISRSVFNDGAREWPILQLECGDNGRAIAFLNEAASLDASAPEIRDLALRLRDAHPEVLGFLHAVHAFVQAAVRFVREERETFQHALYTLKRRAGDCDDHARAVVALARAGGAKARVVGVAGTRGKVGHVAPQVNDGARWWWAETTVPARFGEHPRAAATRLGLIHTRPDLGASLVTKQK